MNGGPMYSFSDQFENGVTTDMLFTPGGMILVLFLCVAVPLVVIAGRAVQKSVAKEIDNWIDERFGA